MQAVVDIGSNSVKFLAATGPGENFKELGTKSYVTRLGRDLEKTGLLSQKSVTDTILALENIHTSLAALGQFQLTVVATSAVRDCKNPESISEAVKKIFSVPLRVLTGQEEAFYSLQGAAAAARILLADDDCVFIDVGGASTEVSVQSPTFLGHSFQAGAVRCHERLGLPNSEIFDAEWEIAKKKILEFFPSADWAKIAPELSRPRPVVAVGGTLVLAAKIAGATLEQNCGIRMGLKRLEDLNEKLRKMSIEERIKLPGMEAGRADIICAGVLVLTSLLHRLNANEVLLTTWGLRHGILLKA